MSRVPEPEAPPERVPAVDVRGLSKTYRLGRVEIPALRDVSFRIAPGTFAAVTGASGSGKSTLLNLVGGLDTPSAGTIAVRGKALAGLDRDGLSRFRRSGVGMVFQSFNLLPARTAHENVAFPLIFSGVAKAERRDRAAALLEQVGLSGRSRHRPAELSGGEQQRVAIARALVNRPPLILADEPTGNLDSGTAREIVGLLAELNRSRGLTILMVTHEAALAREFAHIVIRLRDGRVEAEERLR
ncbi:MAG: ABC transporter ATP-binding protein [Candidatus Aminicenantes bacterium]|nr:ABC transporter ATP-binding protein [Candidatus Aminicenantes bacterium]